MNIDKITNDHSIPPPTQPHAVTSNALKVGQVLATDVVAEDGSKIVTAGTPITPDVLNKLRNTAALNQLKEPILTEG